MSWRNAMVPHNDRIDGLDALRGFAAVGILLLHTIALLKLHAWSELPTFFAYLSLAVPLFFAISAFSLCVGYFGKLNDRKDIFRFFKRRYLRIAPLFYFMMLIYLIRRLYLGWGIPDAHEIIVNLLFIFSIIPGYHESMVAAGWSIGIEMAFYAVFPLCIHLSKNIRSSAIMFLMSLAAALMISAGIRSFGLARTFDWMNPVSQAPFFMGGILMFHLYEWISLRARFWSRAITVTLLVAVPTAIWISSRVGILSTQFFGWPIDRHLVGILLLPLVLAFALYPFGAMVNRVTVFIGSISYGIYLIHPWVINVLGVRVKASLIDAGLSGTWVSVPTIGFVAGMSILLGTLTFYGIERPCLRLGARLRTSKPATARSFTHPC